MENNKVKDFKKTVKQLLSYLAPYKVHIILSILFALIGTIITVIGPKISAEAVNLIFTGLTSKVSGGAGIEFNKISEILINLLLLYGVSMLFSFIQGWLMNSVSHGIAFTLRSEISRKTNTLPMSYFDNRRQGDILSIVTNDVDNISTNLQQSLVQIITSAVQIVGVIVMMFTVNFVMTLATLLVIPVSFVFLVLVFNMSQKYFVEQQENIGDSNSVVEEVYGGHTVVSVFNREKESIKDYEEANKKLYATSWKSQFLSGLMRPIMTFISNLSYVVVSILGGYLVVRGHIQIGDILSFNQYINLFIYPLANLAQIMSGVQTTFASAERVFDFINAADEKEDVEVPLSINGIKGDVEFRSVNFGYNKDKVIINDFSVKVKEGQTIAIVGPTGAGKTTIVKLLLRFYELNSGKILIDGKDISHMKRDDLRSLFGMVLQDTWLFSGTIMDNIRYGKIESSDEEVKNAAKSAYVDHFITTLAGGYKMLIDEEGTNISAGQKQLLTIARVILSNPKILVLDEATSSVDTRTEILIQEAMNKLMNGRTSFIIAHRLSTIRNADMILVMNDGDIVETGNHDELLKKDGFYTELYNSQFSEEE